MMKRGTLFNMKIAQANKDDQVFKDAREVFVGATNRLIENGFITEKEVLAKISNHKKNKISTNANKANSFNDPLNGDVIKPAEEPDTVGITAEVPQDLLNTIISTNR